MKLLSYLCLHIHILLAYLKCALPYRIIVQFHGSDSDSIMLRIELTELPVGITKPIMWLTVCTQFLEAVDYMHGHQVLHNDIRSENAWPSHTSQWHQSDNVLIAVSPSSAESAASLAGPRRLFDKHVVLTDFSKANTIVKSKRDTLWEPEKRVYLVKYPYIAPEVVHGECKQSVYSDMYSVVLVLQKMIDYDCFFFSPKKSKA